MGRRGQAIRASTDDCNITSLHGISNLPRSFVLQTSQRRYRLTWVNLLASEKPQRMLSQCWFGKRSRQAAEKPTAGANGCKGLWSDPHLVSTKRLYPPRS